MAEGLSMGIETALVGAGWSAGAASVASGVVTAIGTAAAGSLVSNALAPKQQAQSPATVTPADAPPKAQAAQDPLAIAKKNSLAASATGSLAGQNSTVLTGSNGINPANLSLGTSTLLGQ